MLKLPCNKLGLIIAFSLASATSLAGVASTKNQIQGDLRETFRDLAAQHPQYGDCDVLSRDGETLNFVRKSDDKSVLFIPYDEDETTASSGKTILRGTRYIQVEWRGDSFVNIVLFTPQARRATFWYDKSGNLTEIRLQIWEGLVAAPWILTMDKNCSKL